MPPSGWNEKSKGESNLADSSGLKSWLTHTSAVPGTASGARPAPCPLAVCRCRRHNDLGRPQDPLVQPVTGLEDLDHRAGGHVGPGLLRAPIRASLGRRVGPGRRWGSRRSGRGPRAIVTVPSATPWTNGPSLCCCRDASRARCWLSRTAATRGRSRQGRGAAPRPGRAECASGSSRNQHASVGGGQGTHHVVAPRP